MKSHNIDLEQLNQEEISKLFKVKKTLDKMMEDRGYIGDKKSFEELKDDLQKKEEMNGIYYKINEDKKYQNNIDQNDNEQKRLTKRLYYKYISQKINADTIKLFLNDIKNSQAASGLIIMDGKISQQAKQKIQEISKEFPIEVFTTNELVVNITEHELVPEHKLLSEEDKKILLERYRIRDQNQLPKILLTDPVARYLGLKRGDVVKIIRESETAGKYITYRIAS